MVIPMTTKVRRHDYGSIAAPVNVMLRVNEDARDRFAAIAARTGVSRSFLFGLIIQNLDLDGAGVPVWWPEHLYPELEPELPMTG